MRVIAGQFRSRLLVAPPGSATRPTSDRLRETLFNVIGVRVEGSRFADLYAGSGAVGIEALSRGATSCFFAERGPAALTALRRNLKELGIEAQAVVDPHPVARALKEAIRQQSGFDLVFLDPPYEAAADYLATLQLLSDEQAQLLAPGAMVIAEHAKRSPPPEKVGALERQRVLLQGDAGLSFYRVAPPERPSATL